MVVVMMIMIELNSVQIFITYVRRQQLQGQLQTQHSVDTGNYYNRTTLGRSLK
jgi:hypothetical protein